jgi:hypothetical protein
MRDTQASVSPMAGTTENSVMGERNSSRSAGLQAIRAFIVSLKFPLGEPWSQSVLIRGLLLSPGGFTRRSVPEVEREAGCR